MDTLILWVGHSPRVLWVLTPWVPSAVLAMGHRPRGGAGASVRGMLENSVVKRKNVSILLVGLLSNGSSRKTFIAI